MSIREGTEVSWSWGNGSDEDPAYVIEQEDGARVLKLRSEVERA
jgi:hypothetical protein